MMLSGSLGLRRPLFPPHTLAFMRRSSTASTHPTVLYLDSGIVAINKPHGFICQYDMHKQDVPHRTLSIMRELQVRYRLPRLPLIVHRLDKPTTGVLLFATSSVHADKIGQQFRQRDIDKTYLAVVRGSADSFPEKTGVVEGMIYQLNTPGGLTTTREPLPELIRRKANTKSEWELLATSPVAPVSLIKVHPLTGFTHQIRVHMADVLDAPILGDSRHLGTHCAELDPAITASTAVPDDLLYLHAAEMTFARYRPSGRRKKVALTVCAPLPDSFVRLCADLMLPLPERYLSGGLYVNGQLVQDSHPILEDLGGRWMPQSLEAETAALSSPAAPMDAQCQVAPTLHQYYANEATQDDILARAVPNSSR